MHAVDRQRKKRIVHQHHPWTFGKHRQFLRQERHEETGHDQPSRSRCPGRAFGTHPTMTVLCPIVRPHVSGNPGNASTESIWLKIQASYPQSNTPDWVYREIEMEALF